MQSERSDRHYHLARSAGVTLIELLVYMTILSVVTIGITQVMIRVQQTNVDTINRADQFADADLALRRIQVKLGNTDDVAAVDLKAGDKACLHLKQYTQEARSGYYFDGRNQYIRSSGNPGDYFRVTGNASRTVSVWVRPRNTMRDTRTVLAWGSGKLGAFGIDLTAGPSGYGTTAARWSPSVRLTMNTNPLVPNCPSLQITNPPSVTPNAWHHIAVTFDGSGSGEVTPASTSIYIDGQKQTTVFQRCAGAPVTRDPINTQAGRIHIARSLGNRRSGFEGQISDIKVWRRVLPSSEILQLFERNPAAESNLADLYAHLPLDRSPSAPLGSAGIWPSTAPAELKHVDSNTLLRRGIADTVDSHFFCFIDDDDDQLYELWESATAASVPQATGETAASNRQGVWTKHSDDIFAGGQAGFFNVVGRDPESVIANIAVGKGHGRSGDQTQKTTSRPLASTRSIKRLELCAIESNALATPTRCSDTFKSAYIAIDGYIPGYHGKLDIQHAQWTAVGNNFQASNLPNLPQGIVATWYPEFGVLKYASSDSQKNTIWSRAFEQTLYRPTGRSSDASLTFNISLGRLAFFKEGADRYYDFVPSSRILQSDNGTNNGGSGQTQYLTFDRAKAHAEIDDAAYCGLEGYLANIATESEQNHLRRVMMTAETPGWQSGWIGAEIDPGTSYTYKWVTGAASEQKHFWHGDGVTGLPFNSANDSRERQEFRKFYEFANAPTSTNRLQNLVQSERLGVVYRYTNWAAGDATRTCDPSQGTVPSANLCEPVSSNPGDAAAIYGHRQRDGTWFSVRDGQYECDATKDDSICGYYIELQKPTAVPALNFARQITRDMSRFREFCQASDNGTG